MIGIAENIAIMVSRAMLRFMDARRTLVAATAIMAFAVLSPCDLSAGVNPEREITLYRLGTPIKFSEGENAGYYKSSGWDEASEYYTWTEGNSSTLKLTLSTMDIPAIVTLKAKLKPFLIPKYIESQLIEVYINGGQVTRWVAKGTKVSELEVRVPGRLIKKRGTVDLEFRIPDAVSPSDFGIENSDKKAHGAAFYEIILY